MITLICPRQIYIPPVPDWENIMSVSTEIINRGITVLLVEHDMSMVMNIADKIYVLNSGRNLAEGTPEEIANNPAVIEAYLGRGEY